MTYFKYLREHGLWLGISAFLILTINIFLFTIKGSFYLAIYVAVTVLSCTILGTYVDYRRQRNFLSEILNNIEEMDDKYLAGEVVGKPSSQEERLVELIIRRMENSMADKVADYRRQNEEYKEYIQAWVHEVKIPLATGKMILENHPEIPLKDSGMEDEIKRINSYVEQALFYARSEAVEKDYLIKKVNLSEIVKMNIVERKKSLISMGAQVDLENLDSSVEVLSDAKWLSFILGQLIDNSIKYSKPDIKLNLSFYTSVDEGKTCLNIQDNGIGIRTADIDRVFEKGFTGYNGRIGKQSTGIGLYLCRKLCLRLEHDIEVSSRSEEGTLITIKF